MTIHELMEDPPRGIPAVPEESAAAVVSEERALAVGELDDESLVVPCGPALGAGQPEGSVFIG